jgi:DNA polymerase elongation subunit (family B)
MNFIIDTDESYKDFMSVVETKDIDVLGASKVELLVAKGTNQFYIEIAPKYMDKYNTHNIIYGKDATKKITNISVKDDLVYIFTEDGHHTLPYKHWVLSAKSHEGFTKLKGNQHYQYIKEYETLDSFLAVKDAVYKHRMYTSQNYTEAFMLRHGYTYFKGMKVSDMSLVSFDIETTGLNPYADNAQVLLITNVYRKNGIAVNKTFCVDDYETQYDMITDWCLWLMEKDPSAIIGHNIIIFDLPYIKAQMDKAGLPLLLGKLEQPLEIEDKIRELRVDGTQTYSYQRINIFGREIVDTFFLAIKADIAKKYDSYALKKIIEQEGAEKPGRQRYDASDIAKNWSIPEEKVKIIQYAEDDAEDPIKLFDLMVAPFFYLTPHIPKPFQLMVESATGSQINSLMVRSYLQDGCSVAKADEIESFEGAISFGNPGVYDNVLKVDVKSLYPSIMRHYKIFPKGKDFNGNFLKALDYFTEERFKNQALAKETNDSYYKDLEQAQKVFINSTYGAMGASGLNYNYGEGASLVTKYGRDIITKAVEWASGHTLEKVIKHITNKGKPNQEIEYEWAMGAKVCEGLGYVISNCDTDSISFTDNRDLSKDEQARIIADLNSKYPSSIYFANDGYFKRAIILRAKNYILFDGKKIKLKGSSLKDKKKEPALKEMTNKMIDSLVHDKQNLNDIYEEYIRECLNVKDIARWASKKSISKAVLNCATDPEARLNERKVYDAIKDIPIQEGDKVYLYPAVLSSDVEFKQLANGDLRHKVINIVGLKRIDQWECDHDVDKLIERVYSSSEILSNVIKAPFIDYTLIKNKKLLDNLN